MLLVAVSGRSTFNPITTLQFIRRGGLKGLVTQHCSEGCTRKDTRQRNGLGELFLVPVLGRGEGGNVWGTRRRRREQKWDPAKIEFS
jgi:hypothetical protein